MLGSKTGWLGIATLLAALTWSPMAAAGDREDGAAAFEAGRWQDAINAYEAVVSAEPEDGPAWSRLAQAHHELGDFAKAIAAWRRVNAIGFRPFLSWYQLAGSYARAGDRKQALDAIGKAIDAGFSGADQLAEDEDLASLRGDKRFSELVTRADRLAHPCRHSDEFRAFDFWRGAWRVSTAQGDHAGDSSVELLLDDCVLLESWKSRFGFTGKSFNIWDRKSTQWVQTWVSSRGELTVYRGGRQGESMQLTTDVFEDDGKKMMKRMTFTPLPDGRVRQHGEQSTDSGRTWTTEYDLYYAKKADRLK